MAKRTRAAARPVSAQCTSGQSTSAPASGETAEATVRKGGPAPGTPSPMRLRMSPELQAHVKRLYEETDQPISQIALDVGVNESVIRRMGPREGWVRYVAPPRSLPPVATLLAEVQALEASVSTDRHPEVLAEGEPRRVASVGAVVPGCRVHPTSDPDMPMSASRTWDGAQERAPQDDGKEDSATREDNIERFTRVVLAHLDEFEALRRDGKLLPTHHLATARAISILTEAFNRLQRMRAALPGTIHDDMSDIPTDLDAYRRELTRRIEAFLASRPDIGVDGEPAAAPAVSV